MGVLGDKLLALAARRKKEIDIEGEKIIVHECMLADSIAFDELLPKNREAALSALFVTHITDPEGEPAFSKEQADEIAKSARVSSFLLGAILSLNKMGAEKKA